MYKYVRQRYLHSLVSARPFLILPWKFQVLPHEICVINEQNYEDLQAEMGDWVEDDDREQSSAAEYTIRP